MKHPCVRCRPHLLWLLACLLIPATLGAQHPRSESVEQEDARYDQEGRKAKRAKKKSAAAKEKVAEEEESWDVAAPPLPTYEIEIDVDEGTWISLDVSPDGDELVFDLLGDLYLLPMAGGEARPLTEGLPWDMQPRFSPNGKTVAFTSDRGGGDNIWLVDRDGKNPRAVTEESFRLLNNPIWTPDGEFVAARKHFTSGRSLGAGEIWLYHRSGGEGLQMVEKPTDQKDLGEPAFSPDGRYLYYSLDATAGGVFRYNKDPNTQIYVIRRLDRKTGEVEDLVSGPGGAIRPTPSPDGKSLAFIRRVRYQSVLFVKDLESGAERPVFRGLDRDMQETWAVHGVYSNLAWTPDSRELVFWAGGKIHRLAVDSEVGADSREPQEIPFRVKTTKKLVEALRFPVEVAPESFDVKMLRWVTVSPDGSRVVYQALGHLWIRDLPEGTPRRLTAQEDHFEFYPAFSRDGQWIAYTTWDDQDLGTVRVAPAAGGEGRVLTTQPGHYGETAFSPDGATVVYRKFEGGYLRTPDWSLNFGVYRIPTAGGKAVRVTREGANPHFGADSERLYLWRAAGPKERSLVSVELEDGHDERVHLNSEWAADFRVSPDEQWVAWVERFQVYLAPFTATGKAQSLGPKSKALPVRQISRDAGDNLHWSGDSTAVHFSVGPELFTRALPEIFAFVDGAPEELPEPPESGFAIGFSAPADRPSGTLALVGGRLITMKGDEIIEDGVVVVDGDRIIALGPRDSVEIPTGALSIDVRGKTLLPGLIDVHWHGAMGTDGITPQQGWPNYASLAYGVTTLHDPSNDTETIFAAAELARAGDILAPRIFSTGTILYGATTSFTAQVDSLDDARSHLRRMKAAGAFSVKSYNQPRRDQRQQFIAGARELEMMVVPEGGSLLQHNLTMIVDGHTGIEHSIPVAQIYDDVRQLWTQSRTGYTPTLVVGYGGIWGENYWYANTDVWADERLLTFVPRTQVDPLARRPFKAPEEEYNHIDNARIASELAEGGVIVTVGAHGQREGLGAHWEMWMLEQGGSTPHEALRAGTLSGARYLGLDGDLGSLEPGKLADIVILGANPLDDLRSSTEVDQVLLGGRLYDARSLNQVFPEDRPREPFFFDGQEGGLTREAPERAVCSH